MCVDCINIIVLFSYAIKHCNIKRCNKHIYIYLIVINILLMCACVVCIVYMRMCLYMCMYSMNR